MKCAPCRGHVVGQMLGDYAGTAVAKNELPAEIIPARLLSGRR
jgi:hypothetical protein